MTKRDFDYVTDHPILKKHYNLLWKLATESKVLCICSKEIGNEFYLEECCDEWYTHDLTKDECLELSELFKEIAEII